MTLPAKLSEMAKRIEDVAEADFERTGFCPTEGAVMHWKNGFKAALSLPEVTELVEAADKFINSEGGMDESLERLDALKEALKKWNEFTGGGE